MASSNYTAAAEFVRLVGEFARTQPEWAECVVYESKPDERGDLTLVSQRVYGNRDEALAVMAAAGLDNMSDTLTERTIVLPTQRQLEGMKALAGFSVDPWQRSPEQAADPVGTR